MIRYDEMLRTFRDARKQSRKFDEETRTFALELVRGLGKTLGVPGDRFKIDHSSDEFGFDDDGWFRVRFSIRFTEFDGSQGGDEIWNTWLLRRDNGAWIVKLYPDDNDYSPLTGPVDHEQLYARFAQQLKQFLATTLENWVEDTNHGGPMEKAIGFHIPGIR